MHSLIAGVVSASLFIPTARGQEDSAALYQRAVDSVAGPRARPAEADWRMGTEREDHSAWGEIGKGGTASRPSP
jgi:hypothetical protein